MNLVSTPLCNILIYSLVMILLTIDIRTPNKINLIPYFRYFFISMSGSYMTFYTIFIAILLPLDVSAIFLNGLVAYLLKKHKKTSIITFWLIYCLSISDVMVGIAGLICHSLLLKPGPSSLTLSTPYIVALLECGFEISGNLVVIIAVDRCIRMKYLSRYGRIITRPRARLIMLFTVTFSILLMILQFAVSEDLVPSFIFGYNIFYAILTLLVYTIYIRTYFLIKSQTTALRIDKRSNIAVHHMPEKGLDVQNKLSSPQEFGGSLEAKLDVVNGSVEEAERLQITVLTKGATAFESQNEAFVLPNYHTNSSIKVIGKKEKGDSIRETANVSRFVEKYTNLPATDTIEKGDILLATREQATTPNLKATFSQPSQMRKATREQEFLKATFFILLALFICYFPSIINSFYTFATKAENDVAAYISEICVLLNSSLNAIILIAFNKEMQRNIKALLQKKG